MRSDRLWPILLVLVIALVAVGVVEWIAAHPTANYVVVEVHNTAGAGEDPEERSETAWQLARPADSEHARARQLLLRGDVDEAVSLYLIRAATVDPSATFLAEVAYALRRAGRCDDASVLIDRALLKAPIDGSIHLADAVTQRCLGNNERAAASFERALELRPNHSTTREVYARFLARTGETDRAIEILELATQAGSNEERAQALASRARLLAQRERFAEARTAVEQAILRAPAMVAIWISGARTLLLSPDRTDHERALEMATQATRLAPDLFAPHSTAGRALERLGREEEALQSYERAASLDSSARFVRTRIVELGLSLNPAAARAAAEQLLERGPDPELYFLHGLACARTGDIEAARASYMQNILARNGVAPETWFNLGRLERDAGRLEAARQAYTSAITVRPDYEAAWNNLGLVYFDLRRYDDAETAFRRAISLRETYASPWSNLGRVLAAQDNYEGAAEAYERALALSPGDRVDRLRLAAAYRRIGRIDESIAMYRALVADEPRYVSAWFNMGIALAASGDDLAAVEAYETAIELDPNHKASLENLGFLEARLGRPERALLHLTEALDRDPSDLDVRIEVASLAAAAGDTRRCAAELRPALTQAPDDPRVVQLAATCGVTAAPTGRQSTPDSQ